MGFKEEEPFNKAQLREIAERHRRENPETARQILSVQKKN